MSLLHRARPSRRAERRALLSVALIMAACARNEGAQPAPSADSATTPAPVASAADKGAQTYGQICSSCHQPTGEGIPGSFPPLKGSTWLLGNPAVPIAIVIAGLQGEIEVNGTTYAGAMQPWGMLSDDDIAGVLTYARSQWGNSAGPVTPAQVKAVRDKIGSRSAWTADELRAAYPGAGS